MLDDAAVDLVRLRAELGERRPLFLDPLLRPLVHQRAHLLFDLIQQPDGFVEAQSGDVHRVFRLPQVVQQRFDTRGLDADPFGLDALADAQLEVQIFGRLHRLRPGREAHGAHHGQDERHQAVAFGVFLLERLRPATRARLLDHLDRLLNALLVLRSQRRRYPELFRAHLRDATADRGVEIGMRGVVQPVQTEFLYLDNLFHDSAYLI